jgi:hypothetical protein
VDPGGTDLQTFFTPVRARNDVIVNLIEVAAVFGAHDCGSLAMELIPASVENDLAFSLKKLWEPPLIVSTDVKLYVTEKGQVRP